MLLVALDDVTKHSQNDPFNTVTLPLVGLNTRYGYFNVFLNTAYSYFAVITIHQFTNL